MRCLANGSCWLLLTAFLGLSWTSIGRADVIYSGDGASAQASVLDQLSEQVGATPASVNSTATINYMQLPSTPATVVVTQSGYASATPGGANVLQIGSTFDSRLPAPVVPAPEPMTWMLWCAVAATSVVNRVRRRRVAAK